MLRPKSVDDLEVGSHWVYCSVHGDPIICRPLRNNYGIRDTEEIIIEKASIYGSNPSSIFLYFKFLQNDAWGKDLQTKIFIGRNEILIRLIKYPTLELKSINRMLRLLKTLESLPGIEFNEKILPILC